MVPSAFVFLEALPLSVTGKIDRRALPPPSRSRPPLDDVFVAPRNLVEDILAKIWAELLNLETVGIHDNFLDLGGHSLLAAQALSRVRDTFHVELPLTAFFETPTVAGLAERIGAADRAGGGPPADALKPLARGPQLPLSFAQERMWFIEQLEPNSPVHNIPAVFRLTGSLNVAVLEKSLNALVARHEVLRSSFAAAGGQPIQVLAPHVSVSLPVVDLRGQPDAARGAETLITSEVQRPFQLFRGPLLRARLLRLTDTEYLFVLVTHHLVFDGLSTQILLRDLSALYESFSAGRAPLLPPLPIQYADFARWQREWLRTDVLAEHLTYWKRQLAGAQRLQMPTDRPRPRVQTVGSARHYFAFPKPLVGGRQETEHSARGHPVHDTPGRLSDAPAPLHRAERHRDRVARRRPGSQRARRPDRLLLQHAGPARRSLRQPHLSAAAGSRTGGLPGGLRPPGLALREARGGATPGAGSGLQPLLPGDVCLAACRGDLASRSPTSPPRRWRSIREHRGTTCTCT